MATNIETIVGKVRRYNPHADIALIRRAHDYATQKHEGQFRRSGEPYIIHPVAVADILADLEMDAASIAAGFLHDVVEDCDVTRENIATTFGEEIAVLVDGVTKLKLADFEHVSPELASKAASEREKASEKDKESEVAFQKGRKRRLETLSSAENLRKILLAMAKDFRVMVIKLCDRLHNMRTLAGLSPERQIKNAEETMQVFAPLAHRLGIGQVKWELEDLAFKYLYPEAYKTIAEQIARTRKEREKDIRDAIYKLKIAFEADSLKVEIQGRPKHLWSIHNKMRGQDLSVDEIFDLTAIRVFTEIEGDCYRALGIVHNAYMPIPGKFDDYIAKRKSNLYQSIHTKVFGPHGQPLEVQIRTWEMHKTAEFGVAAHWAYKERGEGAKAGKDETERKMAFLRAQLFNWQQDAKDSSEFLQTVTTDLFSDQVFVFTPKGDVIDLPGGAGPIDLAYRIHTNVGEHCVGAKANGRIVPLTYVFQNGDICEILTRPQASPSIDWLKLAKSSHARSKIKNYFRRLRYADNIEKGRAMLIEELQRLGYPTDILKDTRRMTEVAKILNKEAPDDLYAAIGFGDTPLGSVTHRLRPDGVESTKNQERAVKTGSSGGKLQVESVDGVALSLARCCLPLPGDEIVGFVSRGKGIVLHRDGCPNILHARKNDSERLTELDWDAPEGKTYETGIIMEVFDRVGLLNDITHTFAENKTFIVGIHTRSDTMKGTAIMRIDFNSPSVGYVKILINKLQNLGDVVTIHRLGAGVAETPPMAIK
jgi:GTP diphosphokinase / guanosine-3',5'-bis(diphosphate) 3'-diphosphatase